MEQGAKISSGQLFFLLLLCRLLTTVTFSPSLGDGNLNGDFLINILLASVLIVLMSIPAIVFYRRFPSLNPVNLSDNTKIISVLYLSVFVYFISVSVSRFFIFMTGIIFPEKNMSVFLVIAVLLSSYCAYLGIEALARGNAVLFFIIVTGVAVILFFTKDEWSLYNLEPLFYNPFSDTVKSSLSAAGRTVESAAFLFLTPFAKGKMKKSFITCIFCFFISLSILFLFLNGVAGEFAKTQLFPFYSLAVIADFPFLESLDAVATALWILAILIKCALFIFISGDIITNTFRLEKKISTGICFVIISALSLFFSLNPDIHRTVSSSIVSGTLIVLSVAIIPSVLLFTKGRKNKRI